MHKMTSTLTERQAIERLMNYNEAERARLYASYETYLDRLRELDEIDRLNEQSTKVEEFVSEVYERPVVTQDMVDEANESAKKIFQNLTEDFKQQMTSIVTEMTAAAKEEMKISYQPKNLCNEIEQPEVPPANVEEPEVDKPKEKPSAGLEPDKLEMRKSLMRGTTNDNRVVAQFAKVILKENVEPMKSKDLVKALNDAGIHMNHPSETLRQIRTYEPTIKNVSYGYYQYVK